MDSLIDGLKIGTKDYFTKSHFSNIEDLYTSTFGKRNKNDKILLNRSSDIETAFMISNFFITIMIIASIVLGFMAVTQICTDQTERGKNTRLGLYILLILTGGQIGWIYILLWVFKVNVCT